MNSFSSLRERIKGFYADYSSYIKPALKFGLALFIYILINQQMGYLQALNKLFILVVLAAASAVLPMNGTVLIGVALIIAHSFGVGAEVGVLALVLFLAMTLLYFRFAPDDAAVLVLTPIACMLKVPAVIPISIGLIREPVSAVSAVFGVLSWKYVTGIRQVIGPMKETGSDSSVQLLQKLPGEIFSSSALLYMIVFAAVVVLTAVICRYLTTFTKETAVIVGGIVYLILMIAGTLALKLKLAIPEILIGTVVSCLIAVFLNQFVYSVDYSESKYIQFEDDDYYYYVKAIPKTSAALKKAAQQQPAADQAAAAGQNPDDHLDETKVIGAEPEAKPEEFKDVNFEEKLEDSLKNL